jgi:hypothetical protein
MRCGFVALYTPTTPTKQANLKLSFDPAIHKAFSLLTSRQVGNVHQAMQVNHHTTAELEASSCENVAIQLILLSRLSETTPNLLP